MMLASTRNLIIAGACATTSVVVSAQQQPDQTAGQRYKNVQVMQDAPAATFTSRMLFMANSLGVNCDHCHNRADMASDEKPTKVQAREMLKMVLALEKDYFGEQAKVNCFTCHRGSTKPATEISIAPVDPRLPAVKLEANERLPSAEEVFAKFEKASGGSEAIRKTTSRVSKGKFLTSAGDEVPSEIVQTPDKTLHVRKFEDGALVVGSNGEVAWRKIGDAAAQDIGRFERDRIRFEYDLWMPARLSQHFKEASVLGYRELGRRKVVAVNAPVATPRTKLTLFFDAQTGLLSRVESASQSDLGWNPRVIDYYDYRDVEGVKIPFASRMTWPHTWQAVITESVQNNVRVDESMFEMPKANGS
jgi:hypothetical protein